jgi:protein phosphatase
MALAPLTQIGPESAGNFEYQWENDILAAHLLTDIGRKRSHNEDSCILCAPENPAISKLHGFLFAVADGMGGANAGELASRLALTTIAEFYYNVTFSSQTRPTRLREAVERANERVFQEAEGNPERHGMGTTLSTVLIHGDCLYVAQVGDSRVYLLRDRKLVQVTEDHSLVAEQVRSGFITEEEARNHSMKNLITRAVGIKDTVKVDLFSARIQQGDTLLICSDGLSNLVEFDLIRRMMAMEKVQGVARILVGNAIENGGTDNVTAVVIRILAQPPHVILEEGAEPVALPRRGIFNWIRRFFARD